MTKEQIKKLYEITEKEINHSLNMMKELLEINSNNETLELTKSYLSNHIDNCKQILSDIKNTKYINIKEKEVVLPYELQEENVSDSIMNW